MNGILILHKFNEIQRSNQKFLFKRQPTIVLVHSKGSLLDLNKHFLCLRYGGGITLEFQVLTYHIISFFLNSNVNIINTLRKENNLLCFSDDFVNYDGF